MDFYSLIAGFAAGSLAACAAAYGLLRRHLRVVRAAEQRARQAQRLAEIGSMTGGLAHEIKNPLSTIGLNAQLLAEAVSDAALDENERRRLVARTQTLRREVDRLRGILQDFLDFAGQIRLDKREVDLNQTVAELADFFLPEAQRHGVRLRIQTAPKPVIVRADEKLLKQALLNLMLNAVQAMRPAPGAASLIAPASPDPSAEPTAGTPAPELILRTEISGPRRVPTVSRTPLSASGEKNQDHLGAIVHVIDTGPGVSPETRERMFQPYFTTKPGGTGLGLPTARRIVEEHGGRIDAHSEPGRGTDFMVVLPIQTDEPGRTANDPPTAPRGAAPS